jgi:hypothetical protein
MIRLSFVLFSALALAIAGCGSSTPTPDAPAQASPPTIMMGDTSITGHLPPETIQGVVRQNFGKFRECYEAGLKKDPKLAGGIKVHFVIKEDGTVTDAKDDGSTLADKDVVACVVSAFAPITYPKPEGGIVTVEYPIMFSPGE